MKFAKELDQQLVPEWRIKYLNYKAGKKYIKAVSRALHKANGTPALRRSAGLLPPRATPTSVDAGPRRRPGDASVDKLNEAGPRRSSPARAPHSQTPGRAIPGGERQRLATSPGSETHYGSFVPTPPPQTPSVASDSRNVFELPLPAMRVPSNVDDPVRGSHSAMRHPASLLGPRRTTSIITSVQGGAPIPPAGDQPSVVGASNNGLRRLFSSTSPLGRKPTGSGTSLALADEVRERKHNFVHFLDAELEKVELFYRQKEGQAGQRLALLKEQLREMRDRRTEEIREAWQRKEQGANHSSNNSEAGEAKGKSHPLDWIDPLKARVFKPGPNSKALQKMPQTPLMAGATGDARRDYIRRPRDQDVPYRTAKRKLKLALQEFYRGIELLKSYALLNRKAFRKLNKKYDKAVHARPPYRYMTEKVNKAWFVNSDVLDGYILEVEDLYARYFERGNHKIAVGKLRSLIKGPEDESASAFRNGLLVGSGLVLALQGLVEGSELLFSDDVVLREQTSYLMQIYGGYFLMLLLFIFFCLDCHFWARNKINYHFIFEFDPRSQLDWRQLAEFPSFFLFVFGLFIWLNFTRIGHPVMYLYYPCILISVTALLLFFPFPLLRHRSRRWFLYSHWRLLLAGLYPVEFRDFFLGDMYCSLTYATCNVELFFCLYANEWNNPVQCNSSSSRLLGFFATLPPIWRALQCLRRYHDTKNVFPHLVNCGKYSMTILSAVCLSLYRIQGTHSNLALFITFSSINAVYCSIWDLFMDFSLVQTGARHPLLRDILGFKQKWPYYVVMVIDPILRFSWIFYAIFTHNAQHSTIVSFLTSFAEVTRRGIWALFRVENEHCANVAQYKASRDVPLPYQLEPFVQPAGQAPHTTQPDVLPTATTTGVDLGGGSATGSPAVAGGTPASGVQRHSTSTEEDTPATIRRRRPSAVHRRTLGTILAEAHKQDFEKKRRPGSTRGDPLGEDGAASSDEDDEEESMISEERLAARSAAGLVQGGEGSEA